MRGGSISSPCRGVGIDDLVGRGYDFWPPKWNEKNLRTENLNKLDGEWSRLSALSMLNRPERVVVADYFTGVPNLMGWLRPSHPMHGRSLVEMHRYLLHKYAHVRPDILAGVGAFVNERMPRGGDPTIAVHIRGSDKLKEDPSLPEKLAAYPGVIEQFARQHRRTRVFLMTDSEGIRGEYAARYGDRLVTTECVRTSTDVGSHFLPGQDRRRIGVEVLTDALLATTCDYFVGLGSSNVTCFIFHLKPWGQRCMMIGPLMTHQMNPYLYMSHEQLDRYLPAETMAKLREKATQAPLA
jgi:protein O-GlcNAc transferase